MGARVAVRVNPDIDARSHPHISTGLKTNKFGIALGYAREICLQMHGRAGLEIVGLHSHIGSQITDLEPLRSAASFVAGVADELRRQGIDLEYVDVGGGLGTQRGRERDGHTDGEEQDGASGHGASGRSETLTTTAAGRERAPLRLS